MMVDPEKVIKGLELCKAGRCNIECPYSHINFGCRKQLDTDAIALLKEHEAVKPKSKVRHGANAQIQHFCGNCNTMLHGKPKYCPECGKGVKWDG